MCLQIVSLVPVASVLSQVGNWPVNTELRVDSNLRIRQNPSPEEASASCHSEAMIPLSPSSSSFYDSIIPLCSLPISFSAENQL